METELITLTGRDSYFEDEKTFHLVLYHFSIYWVVLFGLIAISFFFGSFSNPFTWLLIITLLPGLLFLMVKFSVEKTIMEKTPTMLHIKNIKILASQEYNVRITEIKEVFWAEQLYSSYMYIKGIPSMKNMYRQKVIGIKTKSRVIRIGQELSQDKNQIAYRILKEKLWAGIIEALEK